MPRLRNPVPTYRHHKQSGLAIVTILLPGGARKDVTLGRFNSAESKAEYRRLLALLDANGGVMPADDDGRTVNEVLVAFFVHAQRHYRRADGTQTSEVENFTRSLRLARELFGHTPAAEFGPLALKTIRDRMIKDGLTRTLINQRVGRIRQAFKWAVSEELVPPAVYHGLSAVSGLQRGRSNATDRDPVKPVDDATVIATLPFLPRHVAGLVRFQRLTGCRPGEACSLRRADLETTGPVWLYRPVAHKLSYRNKARVIAVGPRAQSVLAEFPTDGPDEYLFSPARGMAEIRERHAAARKTPKWPSHMERNVLKRKTAPRKAPRERYDRHSYCQAIVTAVEKANARRERLAGAGEYDPLSAWAPNQLRHAHATKVRARFGLEAAQVALGHERADVTQIYAEKNLGLAVEVAGQVG